MSLTSRLSLFFLGMLGLVLIGFSATLYQLARAYLCRQADERLGAALHTLAAAVDVEPNGLEWERHQRQLTLGQDGGADQVRWQVRGFLGGREVLRDRSHNLGPEGLPLPAGMSPAEVEAAPVEILWQEEPWRLARRRIEASRPFDAGSRAKEQREAGEREQRLEALEITAGISLAPLRATLRSLAVALGGLSGGLWLLAAGAGLWLSRRALVPVTTMARAARAMNAADLDQRLPSPHTGDELEDLGRAFNGLLERLQESFERQRRFTGDASHQLRTPLTAMLGQVEVALRRPRSPEEYQRVLGVVKAESARLRQIVEMLLFLARADAEARLPDLQTLDLPRWLESHLDSWSAHPRAANLRVEAGPKGPLPVKAHPALLGQLVDNLLENACKYSEPGSPMRLRIEDGPGVASLSVEDTGCGIPAEDLPHIFEPFYRSAQARRLGQAGLGLGLAVAQRIALAFGGILTARSQVGKGSVFELRLPKEPTAEAPPSVPAVPCACPAPAP
jgi:heavy metal sensor kinase